MEEMEIKTYVKGEGQSCPSNATCWYCGGPLRWESDFNYDEVHGEGDGIVSYLTCMQCGAEVEYSRRDDDEEDSLENPEEMGGDR